MGIDTLHIYTIWLIGGWSSDWWLVSWIDMKGWVGVAQEYPAQQGAGHGLVVGTNIGELQAVLRAEPGGGGDIPAHAIQEAGCTGVRR